MFLGLLNVRFYICNKNVVLSTATYIICLAVRRTHFEYSCKTVCNYNKNVFLKSVMIRWFWIKNTFKILRNHVGFYFGNLKHLKIKLTSLICTYFLRVRNPNRQRNQRREEIIRLDLLLNSHKNVQNLEARFWTLFRKICDSVIC